MGNHEYSKSVREPSISDYLKPGISLIMPASVTEIVRHTRSYYATVFNGAYFWMISAMLTGIVVAHYFFPARVIYANNLHHFLAGYGTYLLPYALAFLLQYIFFPGLPFFRSRSFWILVVLAPALFAFRSTFNFQLNLITRRGLPGQEHYWLQVFKIVTRSLLLVIPVCVVWWVRDKNNQRLYGLHSLKNPKPFVILLALIVPLVIAASFLPGFLTTYPVVLKVVGAEFADRKAASLLFELCYAFDFFSIEFFFRGFLVVAFVRICGMHAIVPAAVFYCCIHLGKPMPEAISSFFGGLLLGIISYHSKSIWGGLLIHIGIAWMMEIVAAIHHLT